MRNQNYIMCYRTTTMPYWFGLQFYFEYPILYEITFPSCLSQMRDITLSKMIWMWQIDKLQNYNYRLQRWHSKPNYYYILTIFVPIHYSLSFQPFTTEAIYVELDGWIGRTYATHFYNVTLEFFDGAK